ncbi:trichohyalin isoform X2 [Hippoglossus stenolepis]|uniref:trichohyalin isoform X2 n=1 Tax=Hippoglossus stenolepis TaxID=195615 RepID=UPI001FAED6EB|nr:trichohyalin isoform X2 [Hippoglossus stenolepis]
MMSKSPRWPELVGNSRTNTPAQKKGGKDRLTVPASGGGKQAGSSVSKPSVGCGRSNSQSSRGSDFTAGVGKVGGSLKRGSLGHHGSVGHPGTGPAPQPGRPALRLCSSRSFSSLHTPSFKTAPFMRSSRSLSRLDERSSRRDSDHAPPNSQDNKGQNSGEKFLNSGRLSTSEEQIRDYEDQCHGDDEEKMSSSSSVSTAAYYHHCNTVKKQTKDGVSAALCAMTSGMRRNWVQAVLKNVRPSVTADVPSSLSGQKTQQRSHQPDSESAEAVCESENPDSCWQEASDKAEDSHQQQREQEKELQPEKEQSCSGSNSAPPPVSPQVEDDHGAPSDPCPPQTDVGVSIKEEETRCEQQQQTVQLVKELEQTQKELSRLQQLNRNLQDELKHERETHSRESDLPQNDLLSNSSEQALTLQRLQKLNHDLRVELETQKRSYEEAREAELQRRVDLLAQQAQLLVTGDATALAQAHLEQDRRCFLEQEKEWENHVSSLKSQLSVSEEQKKEAESRLTQLQQELQGHYDRQQEADRLQKHLQEVETQLCANEEAQADKEARLQKHLMLLQASQDRERRSLAASLEQAQQHSQDLQEMLDRAQEQSLSKTQAWTTEIEVAQQQLQEELTCTVSAVHKLQEEREQLGHHCQELQNQLSEAEGEVSRLQSRLKTDETQYYNLEHSYERVCEELQLALGKAEQRESETQDMREGYERLLDGKEQELTEVLLKMEVLGNSLEETEVKLNEVLKVSNSSEREKQVTDPLNARREDGAESDELSDSSNTTDVVQVHGNRSDKRARNRSRSIDPSYQHIVTAGDDPDRFMSVIQLLERKLYVTEEKLKDITQSLEEHHGHLSCQDPHLYSQLTQSRATAQHLSLLLHSQARQSQRFAQESENRCRVLVGRFQLSLNIVLACRDRLQAPPINAAQFEKQLAAAAACLQQGERDAEKHQHESHNASKGEDKILHDETVAGDFSGLSAKSKLTDTFPTENGMTSVRKCLLREIFVIGKMLSVLQSQRGIGQISLAVRDDEGNVAHKYKSIISQILALRREKITQSRKKGYDGEEHLESVIGRGCAEAELICAALKFQQRYESQQAECEKTGLADTSPPELATYEQQVKVEGRGLEEATEPAEKKQSDDKKVEKEPEWLGRLTSRLQRRARFLKQLCQEISDGPVSEGSVDYSGENGSDVDTDWVQEQAKLIYLSDRLHLHLEQELQQSEVQQNKLQALCKEQDTTAMDEQEEALNHTLCLLQEDNSVLREELERAEQKIISVETGNQRLLEDIQRIEDYHEERMQKLESSFREKIRELQQIHEEEMKHLHGYYTKEKQRNCTEAPVFNESNCDALAAREALVHPQDHGVTAAEEMHRKLFVDLQQQHQMEVAALLQEKDQLLQEETAATMAAIVAMRRAHKQELEKSRQSQHIRQSADIGQLHIEYEKEIQLLHKELEVLSVQHTQKCLEYSQLSQELQSERKCLMQHQQERQELIKKQREMDAMSQLQFSMNGKHSHVVAQTTDFYEMEVILRAREAEMQFLRQEACSLKEELKLARMDKIYAQNKLKTLYTNSQDEQHHDVNKHNAEHFKLGPWFANRDTSGKSLKDSTPNPSNAAFKKKTEKSSLTRQIRARSKSLKDGLSVQERMKLFE